MHYRYNTITAHWINEEKGEHDSATLDCSLFKKRHFARNKERPEGCFDQQKICHLLECDQVELKNLFDDSKKINESSKTVFQKIMKILQKGANVREATLLGIICGYSFGYDVAKKKIEEEMKNRLFNAFKNSNRNQ